jgi:uncharacterized membrane protein
VLCWLPYGVIVVLELFIPRENKTIIQAKAYTSLLAFLNSSVNWIIYGLKNKKIRKAFKQILCRKRKRDMKYIGFKHQRENKQNSDNK